MPNPTTTGTRILTPTTHVHRSQAHPFTGAFEVPITEPFTLPSWPGVYSQQQMAPPQLLPLPPMPPQTEWSQPSSCTPISLQPQFHSWSPLSQPQGTHHQLGFSPQNQWIPFSQPQRVRPPLLLYPRQFLHHQPVCSQSQPSQVPSVFPLTNQYIQDDNVQGPSSTFRPLIQVPTRQQQYQNLWLKSKSPARQHPHENPGFNLVAPARKLQDERMGSNPLASVRQQQDVHLGSKPASPARQLSCENPGLNLVASARQQPDENQGSKPLASTKQLEEVPLGSKPASPVGQLPHENPGLNLVASARQQPAEDLHIRSMPVDSARKQQDLHQGSKPVSPAEQPPCENPGLNLNLVALAEQHHNENPVKQEPEEQDIKAILKPEPKCIWDEIKLEPADIKLKVECEEDLDGVEGKLRAAQKALAIQAGYQQELKEELQLCQEKLQAALKHVELLEKENDELKQQCQNNTETSTPGMQL